MSIVTIKWQGDEKWEQALSRDFEYTGGCGFEIYKSLIRLLTAIEDNFKNSTREEEIMMNLMNESLGKIHKIMGLPNVNL